MSFRETEKAAQHIKSQLDKALKERRAFSAGQTTSLDYFDALTLVRFFEETKEAAQQIVIARNALDKVYFSTES
jgi:hypothetical protein